MKTGQDVHVAETSKAFQMESFRLLKALAKGESWEPFGDNRVFGAIHHFESYSSQSFYFHPLGLYPWTLNLRPKFSEIVAPTSPGLPLSLA